MRYAVLIVAVFGLWALRSYDQTTVWHDERSLWAYAVAVSPEKPRVLVNYGRSLELDGRVEDARLAYLATVDGSDDVRRNAEANREAFAVALTNLGRIERQALHPFQAEAYLSRAVRRFPAFGPARFQLAMLYASQGRCSEMTTELQTVKSLTQQTVNLACEPF
jgi:Tfp pilus assembly protein PilF